MKPTIAVTGITGHSGRFFVQQLIDHQFDGTVKCLVRSSSDTSFLDSSGLNFVKVIGDLADDKAIESLVADSDVVLHIASIRASIPILQKCLLINKKAKIVLVHTTGVFSKHKMAATSYQEIEKEVHAIAARNDLNLTILRPTMIFGDMCDRNIHKFIEMVDKFPIMPEINHGKGIIQPVNARDLAQAYYLSVFSDTLSLHEYNLSGQREITLHDLFDEIGRCLGKKVHHISFPLWFGIGCAKILKVFSLGKKDYTEKVFRMSENRNFSHETASNDFGFTPEDFLIGLKREVDEYLALKSKT